MVKRVGNLMARIASLDNLHEAFLRTARGKETKHSVLTFRQHLDANLLQMQRELLDGTFGYGDRHRFRVYDPKEREISGPSFRMAVVLQAMMRICHPVFDDFQVDGSFASRPCRGTYAALERAQQLAGRYRWFAKLDVCKYFDHISHDVLMAQLCRLFKDPLLLLHFRNILDSHSAGQGRGVPIGYLTSQYFANHYLAVADHWCKEHLKVDDLDRYMDDTLFFSNDHRRLMRQVWEYRDYVRRELQLTLHEPIVNRTKFGIPFLGYVAYRDTLRLSRRSQLRYQRKMRELAERLNADEIDEKTYAQRAQCLVAFVDKADSVGYRHRLAHVCEGIYP